MAKIVDMDRYREEPNPDELDKEGLQAYLETLRARIARLDASEPEDMESEAYRDWGDRHEQLEDLVDDVLDRLDELL